MAEQPADDYGDTGDGEPEVGELATTMLNKDYMGRPLVNATPGTSQAVDYYGRAIMAGNKDFAGRNLVA